MTDAQKKLLADLKEAAARRHGAAAQVDVDERGAIVRQGSSEGQPGLALEEYLWNSGQTMLIRIAYIVWEHVTGEDHEWGRFSTEREAEERIASLFSPGSLGSGEYYIARLYTTRPPQST